eukprot:1670897-Pyramimonas_sp.AAC.1
MQVVRDGHARAILESGGGPPIALLKEAAEALCDLDLGAQVGAVGDLQLSCEFEVAARNRGRPLG